jgi:hypothetical protein
MIAGRQGQELNPGPTKYEVGKIGGNQASDPKSGTSDIEQSDGKVSPVVRHDMKCGLFKVVHTEFFWNTVLCMLVQRMYRN